jgi:hypothetical protein
MGFFFKALAAIVTADAIDRHARSRPTKYWYPNQLPPASTQQPGRPGVRPAPTGEAQASRWDLEQPERPR